MRGLRPRLIIVLSDQQEAAYSLLASGRGRRIGRNDTIPDADYVQPARPTRLRMEKYSKERAPFVDTVRQAFVPCEDRPQGQSIPARSQLTRGSDWTSLGGFELGSPR